MYNFTDELGNFYDEKKYPQDTVVDFREIATTTEERIKIRKKFNSEGILTSDKFDLHKDCMFIEGVERRGFKYVNPLAFNNKDKEVKKYHLGTSLDLDRIDTSKCYLFYNKKTNAICLGGFNQDEDYYYRRYLRKKGTQKERDRYWKWKEFQINKLIKEEKKPFENKLSFKWNEDYYGIYSVENCPYFCRDGICQCNIPSTENKSKYVVKKGDTCKFCQDARVEILLDSKAIRKKLNIIEAPLYYRKDNALSMYNENKVKALSEQILGGLEKNKYLDISDAYSYDLYQVMQYWYYNAVKISPVQYLDTLDKEEPGILIVRERYQDEIPENYFDDRTKKGLKTLVIKGEGNLKGKSIYKVTLEATKVKEINDYYYKGVLYKGALKEEEQVLLSKNLKILKEKMVQTENMYQPYNIQINESFKEILQKINEGIATLEPYIPETDTDSKTRLNEALELLGKAKYLGEKLLEKGNEMGTLLLKNNDEIIALGKINTSIKEVKTTETIEDIRKQQKHLVNQYIAERFKCF